MLVKEAATVWNCLRGIICVHKPANKTSTQVRRVIVDLICKDLNVMECPPQGKYVSIEESDDDPNKYNVKTQTSYSEHPLVIGPYYQEQDLKCCWACKLGFRTSGVFLLGLRDGTLTAASIKENRSIRCYRVSGCFGLATLDGFKDEKIMNRATSKGIRQMNLDRLLSVMQSGHQQEMFKQSGIDIHSQTGYELASKGIIRPATLFNPIIYGIKCVQFDNPHFTLEIQCINETEDYFITLIQEIGMKLRSVAHCTKIQCIRDGHFTLEHALLRKHWQLQHFITNLEQCNVVLDEHKDMLLQTEAALH